MWRNVLRDRDTRWYLTGTIMSSFGDSALWLALGIWVKLLTGSSSAAGLSFFMYTLGSLFGPFGGAIVDRVRRRRLLVGANLATMLVVLSLLFARDVHEIWLIYVVMFFYGVSSGVILPAQTALLPSIVPQDLLSVANSIVSTVSLGFRIVTPLIGAGLLATFGLTPVVLGDAVTFLAATATLLMLRVPDERPAPSGMSWLTDAAEGVRYLWRATVLRDVTIACAVGVVGFGFLETVLFSVVSEGLHRRGTFLGVLESMLGAGAVLAGVLTPLLLRRIGEVRVVGLGLFCAAAGFLLEADSALAPVLVGIGLIGASLPLFEIAIVTLIQRRTPSHLVGRADGGVSVALTVPQTVAIAVGAGLITVVDYRVLLIVMAVLTVVPAGYLFLRRYSADTTADIPPDTQIADIVTPFERSG